MSRKTEIKVAHTAGFCWGVKRAMDMTLATAGDAGGTVYTHGPLIHNPQVIQMLEGKRVKAVKDATELDAGGAVIIRTHGVTPEVRKSLKAKGLKVSDATCPLVARVQGIIKKHAHTGHSSVIIGDLGHAEVTGLLGYAQGRGHVVGSVEDVAALPAMEKVCVVAQTTCDSGKFRRIVEAILARYPHAVVGDTICAATHERQDEALKLAAEVELMVVVGGKNSANTARLADIAREAGAETLLIETEDELDPSYIRRFTSIGLTAGASTPSWMIQRTLDRLKAITGGGATLLDRLYGAARLLAVSNVSVAAGGAFMTLASGALAGYHPSAPAIGLAACYIFAMYGLNQLHDTMTFKHNEPERYRFTLRWRGAIAYASGAAALAAAALAASMGAWPLIILAGAMALGLAYTVVWFPRVEWIRIHRLKDIPASKEIFVAAGWAVVASLIPAVAAGLAPWAAPVAAGSIFVFVIVYIRAVVSGIRDIQGDRVMGRETVPILIGKSATKAFVIALGLGLGLALAAGAWSGLTTRFGWPLLGAVGYTGLYLGLYHYRVIHRGVVFDLALDGVFHLCGALAIGWLFWGA